MDVAVTVFCCLQSLVYGWRAASNVIRLYVRICVLVTVVVFSETPHIISVLLFSRGVFCVVCQGVFFFWISHPFTSGL